MTEEQTTPGDRVHVSHKGGVPWNHAPAPPRIHRHHAQTVGWVMFTKVDRCPCGSIRTDYGRWEPEGPPRVGPRRWPWGQ